MDGDIQHFSSASEEIQYWKKLARNYKQGLEETRAELDEFQMSSRELETELEAQLEQAEQKNRELTSGNERLQRETESLKEKLEHLQGQSHGQISDLEDSLAQTVAIKDELQKYIRELEQHNDDLERTKRSTVCSLEDFESRLNSAIERNAFLESELDEKENLTITVQRLKDEARDLRQELGVTKHIDDGKMENHTRVTDVVKTETGLHSEHNIDSNRLADHTPPPTPTRAQPTGFGTGNNNTPLTPSARISALNIVGDLLRKVGALETKLASFRNYVKDQPQSSGKTAAPQSPLNSPRSDLRTMYYREYRAKRIHRGGTAPNPQSPSGAATQKQEYVKISV